MNFKNTLILIIIVIFSINVSAQKKMNLYFKDGSVKTGYIEFKKDEVKFRAKPQGKKEKYNYTLLDSAATPINTRSKTT